MTGILISVNNHVSTARVVGGTVLALKPSIAANNPEMRIKGNSMSAKYCMIVVVAISKVLASFLKN
jgi:hypothetical protein